MSLLLWRKMVAMLCFVCSLGLQPWSVSEADQISSFGNLKKKFYIRPSESVFLFLILYFMLDGLVLFHIGGFHHIWCLKDYF